MKRRYLIAAAFALAALAACSRAAESTATPTGAAAEAAELPASPTAGEAAATATPEGPRPGQAATPTLVDRVQMYLIALGDAGKSGEEIGCGDSVVPVEVEVEPTRAPLRAALEALLAVKEESYGESGLYSALYQSDLTLDDVAIDDDGTAIIALSGSLLLGGECDTPRVTAQLEMTARQFPTVQAVEIRLNGDPLSVVLEEGPPPGLTPTARPENTVQVFLIALEDAGRSGQEVGCGDSVVPVDVAIDPTDDPLTAALEQLVAIRDETYGETGLYNALHISELSVESVEVFDDGTATVYLGGYVEFGGECDLPRFQAQLEQTALQFPEVKDVEFFINEQPLSVITGSAGDVERGLDRVQIFLIALDDGGVQGPEIGCGDSVVPVERPIEATDVPLRAALEELLAIQTDFYHNTGLYNALYQSLLSVESLTIRADGTAVVRLVGRLVLGGTCDGPRVKAQLEQTILQFDTVSRAEITINGVPIDEALR